MSKVLRVFLVMAIFSTSFSQAHDDFFKGAAAFVGIIGTTIFIQTNKLRQQRRADAIEQDLQKNLEKLSEQNRKRQVAEVQNVQKNRLRVQAEQIEHQRDKKWFMDLVAARGSQKATSSVCSFANTVDIRRCKHITTMPVEKKVLQPLQRPMSKIESFSSMKSSPTPRTKQRQLQADEIVMLEEQLEICREQLSNAEKVLKALDVYKTSKDKSAEIYLAGLPYYQSILNNLEKEKQKLLQKLGKK